MAAPTYSAGTIGNVINAFSLAASKNTAALVDLSTVLGGALNCQLATGATPPTVATTFSCFRVLAATASGNTTLTAGTTGGTSTTLAVASSTVAATIQKGQPVAVVDQTSLVGEIVVVSSVSGTTLTLSGAVINTYSTGALVFLIEQTASGGTVAPGSGWAANTTYGTSVYPPAAWPWIVQAKNGDGAQAVTVTVSLDKNPTFA